MKIHEMRFLTAHTAMASEAYGYDKIGRPTITNQILSVADQLAYGVRGLMLDLHGRKD